MGRMTYICTQTRQIPQRLRSAPAPGRPHRGARRGEPCSRVRPLDTIGGRARLRLVVSLGGTASKLALAERRSPSRARAQDRRSRARSRAVWRSGLATRSALSRGVGIAPAGARGAPGAVPPRAGRSGRMSMNGRVSTRTASRLPMVGPDGLAEWGRLLEQASVRRRCPTGSRFVRGCPHPCLGRGRFLGRPLRTSQDDHRCAAPLTFQPCFSSHSGSPGVRPPRPWKPSING